MSATVFTDPHSGGPPPTLASRPFPRRVRRLLEGILELTADELERGLTAALNDLEQQLFKLAEQARSTEVQQGCFETLRAVKRGRADLVPRFMIGLEASLARIRDEPDPAAGIVSFRHHELSLVAEGEVHEHAILAEIASRAEVRNSLALWLLGQRFGVLAGRPAFEPETLPIGPHSLCRILAEASNCLELAAVNRALMFRSFDRLVMPLYGSLVESVNNLLIRESILPRLMFVPIRTRPATPRAQPSEEAPGRRAAAVAGASGPRTAPAPGPVPAPVQATSADHPQRRGKAAAAPPAQVVPYTYWPGETPPAPPRESGAQPPEELFGLLRELLASRRQLLAKLGQAEERGPADAVVASPEDVRTVLGVLQQRPVAQIMVDGRPVPRAVRHVKQDLLAQLRQVVPDGKPAVLGQEEADTIELVDMLFEHIMKDVRPNSAAAMLLSKLQVPLLRVALDDHGFFTRTQHPARQMLNTIAETGAQWLGDEDSDRSLIEKMQMLVDRAVTEFDGDTTLFQALHDDLSGHLQTVIRKAEVAERRHVEAARGKERLALAQERAGELVSERLRKAKVPRFVRTLLTQAWADVLALTLLRQGEDSDPLRRQLRIAERLIESAAAAAGEPGAFTAEEAAEVEQEVVQALGQVGYHDDDAQAIASRLVSREDETDEVDRASRTELALRMKARSRLGEDLAEKKAAKKLPPLNADEQAALEQIKQLPFGTWFEFIANQQGDRVRRRLSWYSTLTGHVLFVNHRGQRVGEHTLDWLARAMAAGQASLVLAEKGSLIDRAWNAIVGALRSFGGPEPHSSGDVR